MDANKKKIRIAKFLTSLFLSGGFCFLSSHTALAEQTLSLAWDPDPAASGYYLYYGSSSGAYSTRVDVNTNTVATVSALKEGQTYYFAVSAYDPSGLESSLSTEISFIIPGVVQALSGTQTSPIMLRFPVAPAHSYDVQASADLVSWTTIWQTSALSNAWVNFSDMQSNVLTKRFYRIVSH